MKYETKDDFLYDDDFSRRLIEEFKHKIPWVESDYAETLRGAIDLIHHYNPDSFSDTIVKIDSIVEEIRSMIMANPSYFHEDRLKAVLSKRNKSLATYSAYMHDVRKLSEFEAVYRERIGLLLYFIGQVTEGVLLNEGELIHNLKQNREGNDLNTARDNEIYESCTSIVRTITDVQVDRLHGVPINQWRNISAHRDFNLDDDHGIVVRYGRNSEHLVTLEDDTDLYLVFKEISKIRFHIHFILLLLFHRLRDTHTYLKVDIDSVKDLAHLFNHMLNQQGVTISKVEIDRNDGVLCVKLEVELRLLEVSQIDNEWHDIVVGHFAPAIQKLSGHQSIEYQINYSDRIGKSIVHKCEVLVGSDGR